MTTIEAIEKYRISLGCMYSIDEWHSNLWRATSKPSKYDTYIHVAHGETVFDAVASLLDVMRVDDPTIPEHIENHG